MLKSLKFVQGAVKKNVISPEMEHYRIADGRIVGYNGHMALSAPLPLDIKANPKADLFFKAVQNCTDAASIDMTAAGRLAVRSGAFKAFIPCLDDLVHTMNPVGETYEVPEKFVAALRRVEPFVSEDASRPWSMGVYFEGQLMMATNNVTLVQVWAGKEMPKVNIPRFAVQEIIRIGEQPEALQSDGRSLTVHYADGRWLTTSVYDTEWPMGIVAKVFAAEHEATPVAHGLFAAVEKLAPFIDGKSAPLYFLDGRVATSLHEDDGASIDVEGLVGGPCFNLKQMQSVGEVAKTVDWSLYPGPCIFYGENLRGIILGRTA